MQVILNVHKNCQIKNPTDPDHIKCVIFRLTEITHKLRTHLNIAYSIYYKLEQQLNIEVVFMSKIILYSRLNFPQGVLYDV